MTEVNGDATGATTTPRRRRGRLCTLELGFTTDPITREPIRGNCCTDGSYLDLLDRYPDWLVVAVRGPQDDDGPRNREQLALLCSNSA